MGTVLVLSAVGAGAKLVWDGLVCAHTAFLAFHQRDVNQIRSRQLLEDILNLAVLLLRLEQAGVDIGRVAPGVANSLHTAMQDACAIVYRMITSNIWMLAVNHQKLTKELDATYQSLTLKMILLHSYVTNPQLISEQAPAAAAAPLSDAMLDKLGLLEAAARPPPAGAQNSNDLVYQAVCCVAKLHTASSSKQRLRAILDMKQLVMDVPNGIDLLVRAGEAPALVQLLRKDTAKQQELAAAPAANMLAVVSGNLALVRAGAVPALLGLLLAPQQPDDVRLAAATALYGLAEDAVVREEIAQTEGLCEQLLRLLRWDTPRDLRAAAAQLAAQLPGTYLDVWLEDMTWHLLAESLVNALASGLVTEQQAAATLLLEFTCARSSALNQLRFGGCRQAGKMLVHLVPLLRSRHRDLVWIVVKVLAHLKAAPEWSQPVLTDDTTSVLLQLLDKAPDTATSQALHDCLAS